MTLSDEQKHQLGEQEAYEEILARIVHYLGNVEYFREMGATKSKEAVFDMLLYPAKTTESQMSDDPIIETGYRSVIAGIRNRVELYNPTSKDT